MSITAVEAAAESGPIDQRAHWLTADIIAWKVTDSSATYSLVMSPTGGVLRPGGAGVDVETVTLQWESDTLPEDLASACPHLSDYAALRVPDCVTTREALKGSLIVVATRPGRPPAVTGVQIAGVIDDLYADPAAKAALGVTWHGAVPTLRLWAPTARSVILHRFGDPEADPPGDASSMTLEVSSGVWSVTGEVHWNRQYYLYEVEVFVPSTGARERNMVTDPYSVSLAANSVKSQIVDLDDPELQPEQWEFVAGPGRPAPRAVYELHVRDFSISDETVPVELRGSYRAFTQRQSDGMRHLQQLAGAGLDTLHLLPTFDIASVEELRSEQIPPDIPSDAGPASTRPQAAVRETAGSDGFNWGYDPFHYMTPEGSYATDPQGPGRILECRQMVQSLASIGLGVVNDVVFNHTHQAGQGPKSVLDKVVPGYYHRLLEDGSIATSTCCPNTATEHAMMEKLMVDSVALWATAYRVAGFRFDLMGHHSKDSMLAVRAALDALTLEHDGVDGSQIYIYGEGWNFGEVADNARFVQAIPPNMAGTGIGMFNDRLRDAVRGGGPFDHPRIQGFASGLFTDPNTDPVNGSFSQQHDRLLLAMDQIRIGLAGNLSDYTFVDRHGATVTGHDVPHKGAPTGYAADPRDTVLYVSAHDNETLYDSQTLRLPQRTPMADRIRLQHVALSTVALGQGVSFFHAGCDMLRSKSFDRNSYNSGDHFNRIDFRYETNNFGVGLPPAPDNEPRWPMMTPFLTDPKLTPAPRDIADSVLRFRDLLSVASSSPLFSLPEASLIQAKMHFLNTGEGQIPGLIVMHVDDTVGDNVDPNHDRVVVLFNAAGDEQAFVVEALSGTALQLHPVQAAGADPVVQRASFDQVSGTFSVPARTTAVFVERSRQGRHMSAER